MKTNQQIYPGLTLTIGSMLVMTMGCRTFDYTEEDMEREQRRLDQGPAERSSGVSWAPDRSVNGDQALQRATQAQPHIFSRPH